MSGWWFPVAISRHAAGYDVQFARTLLVAGIVFVAAQCALIALVWRFRSTRRATTEPKPAHPRIELLGMAATTVVFLGLLAMGGRIWAGVQFTPAPPDAEVIEVQAKQFAWNFRYPGPDGQFGSTDVRLIDDAAGNPFGLDEHDPRGKDDIVSATLRVPVGRPVKLLLISRDVIHSFFVRELRLKQDLVPGMRIPLHFKADTLGTYEVPCAELCGLGHFQMRTTLTVMTEADYQAWKRGQTQ